MLSLLSIVFVVCFSVFTPARTIPNNQPAPQPVNINPSPRTSTFNASPANYAPGSFGPPRIQHVPAPQQQQQQQQPQQQEAKEYVPSEFTFSDGECRNATELASVLVDMLSASEPSTDLKRDDIIQELLTSTRSNAAALSNRLTASLNAGGGGVNEKLLAELLQANEICVDAIDYYNGLAAGAAVRRPVRQPEQKASSKQGSRAGSKTGSKTSSRRNSGAAAPVDVNFSFDQQFSQPGEKKPARSPVPILAPPPNETPGKKKSKSAKSNSSASTPSFAAANSSSSSAAPQLDLLSFADAPSSQPRPISSQPSPFDASYAPSFNNTPPNQPAYNPYFDDTPKQSTHRLSHGGPAPAVSPNQPAAATPFDDNHDPCMSKHN